MTLRLLRSSAEIHNRRYGSYDLSVWASADFYTHEIARLVGSEELPHTRMQVSTAGAVRAAGCEILLTEPPPGHHSIRFLAEPTDDELGALMKVFSTPRTNPVARKKVA